MKFASRTPGEHNLVNESLLQVFIYLKQNIFNVVLKKMNHYTDNTMANR